ncbi:hypothetical protein MBRA1_000437 [Malassezia brasiliensis]|uniref:[histone H3]-trimethyl-L-lysine(4) demethylase n=1 Tax=Malassezia brasiliensis TaxID=1821822 RepID=A0AAF0DPY7_9BASI|nr:hypothetical protein MBRA1_000437 [Malassezia brasiliensis]
MSMPVDTQSGGIAADVPVKAEPNDTPPLHASPRRVPTKRETSAASTRGKRGKRAPEHISCRDLGRYVDGVDAEAIEREVEAARAERKSKTQALSAMARASDPTTSDVSGNAPGAHRHATRKMARMPRLPPLVYDYMHMPQEPAGPAPIATAASTPRRPLRTQPRVFGLEEAPTFYPTWEEFQDPMAYIEWVAKPDGGNGVAYGIAKIVPPEGWQMEFVADEQTFRFRTRVQRLNELSAEGRVAQNYREQLEQFHHQQGHGRISVPRLSNQTVDLYALKLAVQNSGEDDWSGVAQALQLDDSMAPSVLKNLYTQLVAPFEAYLAAAKQNRVPSALKRDTAPSTSTSDMRCEVCRVSDAEPQVVCSDCERTFHVTCASLPHAPRGDWVCSACLMGTGGDFGFDDGETHSLHSFWQRCAAFQRVYAAHAIQHATPEDAERWERLPTRANTDPTLIADEDLVEAEFWRLVHSAHELVDVEYGADVHSSVHGNASPNVERQPLSTYARSGWNMNNLPILPASLLRYIKSEISGMTVPWIYIGMMFSAFCWHNEDHYTYSVNYQHWGATKTWYGVPGADAEKFEAAMQRIAPGLFEACPDLLLQLVTMMSPALAKREGVRTYACNQRPNEFVLTFPKAYHSGFNHGFNLNEAVNFALPDWVMDGLACVRRYQSFARQPVFSHDELLITIALHNQQLQTAVWLHPAYRDMVDRELAARNALRALPIAEECAEYDRREAEYQCQHCKTLCYLSQVVSRTTSAIACLIHAREVHGDADPTSWVLRLRFPDAYLETHAAKLADRAAVPRNWQERVRKLLLQHPRPPLRTLQALAQEGEKIAFPLPELEQLQAFLSRALPWAQRAEVFLTRRQKRSDVVPRRRGRPREATASPAVPETPPGAPNGVAQDRSPEALLQLCATVPTLPFDTPEFASLQAVVEQMDSFRHEAAAFLAKDPEVPEAHHCVDDAERVLSQGSLLHVDVPEVTALRRWIAHAKWFAELHGIGDKFLSLEDVDELLAEAKQADIDDAHAQLESLRARRSRGEAWGMQVQALLDEAPSIERAALDELLAVPANVATATELRARVASLQHKATQWRDTLASIYEETQPQAQHVVSSAQDPPRLAEARQVLTDAEAARVVVPLASEIAEGIALHDKWNAELAHILRKVQPRGKGNDPIEVARSFCDHTARAASASALKTWEEYASWKAATEREAAKAVASAAAATEAQERGQEEGTMASATALHNATADTSAPSLATEVPAAGVEAPAPTPAAPTAPTPAAAVAPMPSTAAAPAASPIPSTGETNPCPSEATSGAAQAQAQSTPDAVHQPQSDASAPVEGVPMAPVSPKDVVSPAANGTAPATASAPVSAMASEAPAVPTPLRAPTPPPAPAPCLCFEELPERTASVTCTSCQTLYHLKCLDLRPKGLGKQWQCPFCDREKLPPLVRARHAVSQLPLVALLQNTAFQRDKFRFLPSNYMPLQAAIRATVEFGVAVTMRFRSGVLPPELVDAPGTTQVRPTPFLSEVARRGVGCPVDVLLIADATPKQNVPSVLDALLPAFGIQPERRAPERKPSAPKPAADGATKPVRRSKRARLTFREEKLPMTSADVPVHCFCGQPDTGTMVQCDKCTLWFHNTCMCIDDLDALQEKWFCPVCCLRLRRRYPFAEVRIVDETPTAPPPPLPPNLFVDVQSSLRSETTPVHKVQHWTNERRILLHLVHFEPAVLAPSDPKPATTPSHVAPPGPQPPPPKRAKLSPDHDWHHAGRLNLLRRGVSEAMMQRYAMGWNGEAIVCQLAPDRQVVLGPTIRLAPDDADGTRLLRMALEAAWRPPPPPSTLHTDPRPLPTPVPERMGERFVPSAPMLGRSAGPPAPGTEPLRAPAPAPVSIGAPRASPGIDSAPTTLPSFPPLSASMPRPAPSLPRPFVPHDAMRRREDLPRPASLGTPPDLAHLASHRPPGLEQLRVSTPMRSPHEVMERPPHAPSPLPPLHAPPRPGRDGAGTSQPLPPWHP